MLSTAFPTGLPRPPLGMGTPPPGSRVVGAGTPMTSTTNAVFPVGSAAVNPTSVQHDAGGSTYDFLLRHRGDPLTPLNPGGVVGAWFDCCAEDVGYMTGLVTPGAFVDVSRCELSGLGVADGTWEVGTTVRLDPTFVASAGPTSVMRPIPGTCSVDVVPPENVACVTWNGSRVATSSTPIVPGSWTSIRVRVSKGWVQLSVNDGPWTRASGLSTAPSPVPPPAWGLRSSAVKTWDGKPLPDLRVQHRTMYVCRMPTTEKFVAFEPPVPVPGRTVEVEADEDVVPECAADVPSIVIVSTSAAASPSWTWWWIVVAVLVVALAFLVFWRSPPPVSTTGIDGVPVWM